MHEKIWPIPISGIFLTGSVPDLNKILIQVLKFSMGEKLINKNAGKMIDPNNGDVKNIALIDIAHS